MGRMAIVHETTRRPTKLAVVAADGSARWLAVVGASAGRALRGQCRYFLAEELAGHPDHGGCGWVKWYARADRGTDTAPQECGHCLAGELAM